MEINGKIKFFVPAVLILGSWVSSVGADKDGFSLSVEPGTPAALPRLASIGEKVTFRFSIIFKKGDQRLEKLPPEVIGMEYHLICDSFKTPTQQGTIRAVEPLMTINADGKTAELKGRVLLLDILAVAGFPTDGNHYLLLWVKAIFRDGSFLMFPPQQATLQQIECATIHVPVTDATFTIYACPPEVRRRGILGGYQFFGGVGHSFFRIGLTPSKANTKIVIPDDVAQTGYPRTEVPIVNKKIGFYPGIGEKDHLIDSFRSVKGHIYNDDDAEYSVFNKMTGRTELRKIAAHEWYSSVSYVINADNAIGAINAVVNECGTKYLAAHRKGNILVDSARSCTSQSSYIASIAGCTPPDGVGRITYFAIRIRPEDPADPDNPNGIYMPPVIWRCPNPYTHTVQIGKLPQSTINPHYKGKKNDLD